MNTQHDNPFSDFRATRFHAGGAALDFGYGMTTAKRSPDEAVTLGNCCKLLAACFYEPDKELFLEEQVLDNLKSLLEQLAPAAAAQVGIMKENLSLLTEEELKIDYAALFVGPFELIAAPYGSVYLERHRTVMGDTTQKVQGWYRDAGLQLDLQEPPDHIAIELEFLHYLCLQEAEALAVDDPKMAQMHLETRIEFTATLMGWLPAFARQIKIGAETGYYRALASCLVEFYRACFGSRAVGNLGYVKTTGNTPA